MENSPIARGNGDQEKLQEKLFGEIKCKWFIFRQGTMTSIDHITDSTQMRKRLRCCCILYLEILFAPLHDCKNLYVAAQKYVDFSSTMNTSIQIAEHQKFPLNSTFYFLPTVFPKCSANQTPQKLQTDVTKTYNMFIYNTKDKLMSKLISLYMPKQL